MFRRTSRVGLVLLVLAGLCSAGGQASAQADNPPVVLSDEMINRYLDVRKRLGARIGELRGPKTKAEKDAVVFEVCQASGFSEPMSCIGTLAYVPWLLSGYNAEKGVFEDPVSRGRALIARIEADSTMAATQKKQKTAVIQRMIDTVKWKAPQSDLDIMTRHRDRLVPSLKRQ